MHGTERQRKRTQVLGCMDRDARKALGTRSPNADTPKPTRGGGPEMALVDTKNSGPLL